MTPRGMRLGLLLAVISSPTLVEPDGDHFGRAVTCCLEGHCGKLDTFVWRHAEYGVDIMIYDESWCQVRLRYFPLMSAFDGVPSNICDLLACFPNH
jgi:hypothetical protein